jgi:hypothetical protein
MASSGMLSRVALVRTDVTEERIASIIRVRVLGELGTTLAITNNGSTQRTVTFSLTLTHALYVYDHCIYVKIVTFSTHTYGLSKRNVK